MKLSHKDRIVRCRFFEVPGDGSALLGIPYLELLGILNIMHDVVEGQQGDRKFNSQTVKIIHHSKLQSKHRLGEQVK